MNHNSTPPNLIGVNDQGYRVGQSHHNAKLSDATVQLVRELHEEHKLTCRQIAAQLGLNYHTVRALARYSRRVQVPCEWRKVKRED